MSPCSFTWVLYEGGELKRYFEGDDVPGYALYTATWGLIVPHLAEAYPGNRKMGVQVQPRKKIIMPLLVWLSMCSLRMLCLLL